MAWGEWRRTNSTSMPVQVLFSVLFEIFLFSCIMKIFAHVKGCHFAFSSDLLFSGFCSVHSGSTDFRTDLSECALVQLLTAETGTDKAFSF